MHWRRRWWLRGGVDEAKARYRKILVMQPSNANALNDLAYLMAESGENLDQALANAQLGLRYAVEPGLKAMSLSDTMGWIYVKQRTCLTARYRSSRPKNGGPKCEQCDFPISSGLCSLSKRRQAKGAY